MAEYIIQDTTLINIANAIRAKKGSSAKITPNNMVSEIDSISGAIENVSSETDMDNNLVISNLVNAASPDTLLSSLPSPSMISTVVASAVWK